MKAGRRQSSEEMTERRLELGKLKKQNKKKGIITLNLQHVHTLEAKHLEAKTNKNDKWPDGNTALKKKISINTRFKVIRCIRRLHIEVQSPAGVTPLYSETFEYIYCVCLIYGWIFVISYTLIWLLTLKNWVRKRFILLWTINVCAGHVLQNDLCPAKWVPDSTGWS